MVKLFNSEMPRVMRVNPVVELPGDVLLIGRVLGLLFGIGKQLGSEVDVGALLVPYLGRVVYAADPELESQRMTIARTRPAAAHPMRPRARSPVSLRPVARR